MYEDLKKLIYPIPKGEIDKAGIKSSLYNIVSNCMIEGINEIDIEPYFINIDPQNLSAKYQTETTRVEISNKDIYYETQRQLEDKLYVISNQTSPSYPANLPYFLVAGNIVNFDGTTEEHYSIELISETELNIIDYLNIDEQFSIVASDNKNIVIAREIKKDDIRYNTYDLFKKEYVKEVFFDRNENIYLAKDTYNQDTYSKYLPELDKEKEIITLLCETIVEIYQKLNS